MQQAAVAEAKSSQIRFFPVPVDSLDAQTMQMDLYIKTTTRGAPTLYRSAGLAFSEEDRRRLIDQRVEFLYINCQQHAAYRRSLSTRLERTFCDESVARTERARVIRAACTRMIEDTLLLPGESEPIQAIFDISNSFAVWSDQDPKAFSYILDMSAHDFYTTTHMVNVGVGCGLLVRELHPGDQDMFAVAVQGGLLHDLGKRDIPEEILNKEGKLSEEEFALIKRHPAIGYEELRQNLAVPEAVLEMVRDHHERLDGTGYPMGASGDRISFLARVCAVVDVFDAITAARPYRGPTPPLDAIKIMKPGRGGHFDPKVFDAWEAAVGRMVAEDPSRAPAPSPDGVSLTLDELTPALEAEAPSKRPEMGMSGNSAEPNLWSDNRRRYERFGCAVDIRARFLTQGKACGIKVGQMFAASMRDISRGGLQIRTQWPLTLNDLMEVEIPNPKGSIKRRTRVVRVRQVGNNEWSGGLSFCEGE